MKFPTLYKKTQTGAIQAWHIEVEGRTITTTFGHVDGKQQTLSEDITEGKNLGRANATTAEEQAVAEAKSKWEKQAKKGYVQDVEQARAGAVDTKFVQGGVAPMLAPSKIFGDDKNLTKKMDFPAYVQPKLDGSRCIAVISHDGEVSLWSRTRKPIKSVPHIVEALQEFAAKIGKDWPTNTETGELVDIVLDGELYNHSYGDNFEGLMSIIRKDEPDPSGKYTDIQYHVYDLVATDMAFKARHFILDRILTRLFSGPLFAVCTVSVHSQEQVFDIHDRFVADGYEGAMVRHADGQYESGKRSSHLQKVKRFQDTEFKIVDAKPGRGKFAKCAIFTCETADGKTFECAAPGTIAQREAFLEDETTWKDQFLTVKYQGLTGAAGVPRFPVAKEVRPKDEVNASRQS